MWLINSSVGRKLVMSISGLFLVLFVTFHMAMNLVAVISEDGYDAVCEFLGANWYALAGTAVLALGFVVHIVYAFILTAQNRRARGNQDYAVSERIWSTSGAKCSCLKSWASTPKAVST